MEEGKHFWTLTLDLGTVVLYAGIEFGVDLFHLLQDVVVLQARPDGVVVPCVNQVPFVIQGREFARTWARHAVSRSLVVYSRFAYRRGAVWHVTPFAVNPEDQPWDEQVACAVGTRFALRTHFFTTGPGSGDKPLGLFCVVDMANAAQEPLVLGPTCLLTDTCLGSMVIPCEGGGGM